MDNAVEANLLAAAVPKAAGEVMNVACGKRASLLDLVQALGETIGREIAPMFAGPRAGDVKHSEATIDKAKAVLGYSPRIQFREGLQRTVEWFAAVPKM